jgi:hypothetical protein
MKMSRLLGFAAALAITLSAVAQTDKTPVAKPKAPAPAPKKSATPAPAPDTSEPVITIQGLCAGKQTGAQCRTVVTKNEFEKLMRIAKVPPAAKTQAAEQFVKLLIFSIKGEKLDLEDTPVVKDRLYVSRLGILAGAYDEYLKTSRAKVSEDVARKYYNDNQEAYGEITLSRLFIPKPPQGGDKKPLLDEAATKQLAEKMRERAAAGEDLDKLEQEIIAATTPDMAKAAMPPTSMGARRRGLGLPPQHEAELFALDPGKVSPLYEEPTSFMIYKVQAKRTVPFDDVKAQITSKLETQAIEDARQAAVDSVKTSYNESYFKPAETPSTAQHPPKAPAASTPAPPAGSGTQPAVAPTPPQPPAASTAAPK